VAPGRGRRAERHAVDDCGLYNGFGRYEHALVAAQPTSEHAEELLFCDRSLIELIEAAALSRKPERAAAAVERLSEATRAGGTEWALGIEPARERCRAENDAAERLYREAIDRFGRTRLRVELARAHLLSALGLDPVDLRLRNRADADARGSMVQRRSGGLPSPWGRAVRVAAARTDVALTPRR
jgi:hypothetical protein